jgi:transcription elongation factor
MKQFLMSITIEKHTLLQGKAKKEGITFTELIRRIIDDWLKRETK